MMDITGECVMGWITGGLRYAEPLRNVPDGSQGNPLSVFESYCLQGNCLI